ncbi:MAG: hypothetical protein R6T83_00685 [Salinibacter sp.]
MLGLGPSLGGCSSPSDPPPSPFLPSDSISAEETSRDSALAVLTDLQRTAFDSAFATLDTYAVSRRVRTEQLTPAGSVSARRTSTVRYPPAPDRGVIQERDSTGPFRDGGILSSLSGSGDPTDRPQDIAPQALSDPPAFVAPRTREDFRYALHQDTLSNGTPVQVVRAQARNSGPARDQGLRFARLKLLSDSHELVALTVVRAERTLLFGEDSRLTVRLRPAPTEDTWVPALVRFRARVDVPVRAPRQFLTVSRYDDYTR